MEFNQKLGRFSSKRQELHQEQAWFKLQKAGATHKNRKIIGMAKQMMELMGI
jgi:hypothetical protein